MKLLTLLGSAGLAASASLQQVSYSPNPANVPMYVYKPDSLPSSPALVVAVHYCTGSAQAYYQGTQWHTYADSHGFIVIYPSSPHSGTCWDVSSKATLTHNGGGDSNSIANMAKWAVSNYGVDANKVFVTGASSGAMMTNVLAATYPDVFKAGSAYSGVPAGCFVSQSGGVDAWNSTCAQGQVNDTPQQWANVVKAMGASAPYPKMQIWHGSVDTTLYPNNYQQTINEWAGVFGISNTPSSQAQNTPQSNYRTDTFGDGSKLQGIYATGVGHTVPEHVDLSMKWFGLS